MPKKRRKTKAELAAQLEERRRKWEAKLALLPPEIQEDRRRTHTSTGQLRNCYKDAFRKHIATIAKNEPTYLQLLAAAKRHIYGGEPYVYPTLNGTSGDLPPPAPPAPIAPASAPKPQRKTGKRLEFEQNYATLSPEERRKYDRMYTRTGRLRKKYAEECARRHAAGRASHRSRRQKPTSEE